MVFFLPKPLVHWFVILFRYLNYLVVFFFLFETSPSVAQMEITDISFKNF